ncbi:hypothetical protein A3J19_04335 [Candidatus Daviesbacteria bacterium RIFCSPLOWO2_02_FULL_41_8]|uniref:DUF304 domain-containing protein n=1 Tax=Candidatus Daviesbacteria bacterium RIFCSPLOWO2_02_FULL_41_8 TaxID=1797798 RepID=A0A1F5NGQ0_9BACT|nr:MAG: hypothetical protein A3J19_04335 [Candidatus Daviesbacteria bacterium RIFCSPLOWO2_02_FULL_41_8]HLB60517.1 hypothetical protein [Patescibacteria group bacterium]
MPVVYQSPKDKTYEPPPRLAPQTSVMSSYVVQPSRVYFATQAPGERILLFLRKHPITQLPWIIGALVLISAPLLILPALSSIDLFPLDLPLAYSLILIVFWYLMTFSYIFVNFILWYYNINIVTNMRIVDIDFLYLLVQEVTATRIGQVEDITYQRTGLFAALFDYGDVVVQTAGEQVNIEFLATPRPKDTVRIIIDLMGKV